MTQWLLHPVFSPSLFVTIIEARQKNITPRNRLSICFCLASIIVTNKEGENTGCKSHWVKLGHPFYTKFFNFFSKILVRLIIFFLRPTAWWKFRLLQDERERAKCARAQLTKRGWVTDSHRRGSDSYWALLEVAEPVPEETAITGLDLLSQCHISGNSEVWQQASSSFELALLF